MAVLWWLCHGELEDWRLTVLWELEDRRIGVSSVIEAWIVSGVWVCHGELKEKRGIVLWELEDRRVGVSWKHGGNNGDMEFKSEGGGRQRECLM